MKDTWDTPFQNKCRDLIAEIHCVFEKYGFIETFINKTKTEFKDYVFEKLNVLSDEEKCDFNEMGKMLSSSNCWYVDYEIGKCIHEVLIERIFEF